MSVYEIVFEQEMDGRWLAIVENISGAMAYGKTKKQAERKLLQLIEILESEK